MRILFMGTPDFALYSLRALVESGENVIGAVTQTDKPKGRGYELQESPVKKYAKAQEIPVFQPATLRNGAFDPVLSELRPDLIVVTAYGKILPESVLNAAPYGCINVHGSLLPAYRGAAPIQRAILDGCTETGVTTMKMDAGVDTGDMLLACRVPIGEEDNFETVHDRLAKAGAELLLQTVAALRADTLIPRKQDGTRATYAAKIEKTDAYLNFADDAVSLHNRVRALSPFPLAFTHTPDGKLLKVTAARVGENLKDGACPGEILSLSDGITVACGHGCLKLYGVLPEGKGRMSAVDYLRGRKLAVGDILK